MQFRLHKLSSRHACSKDGAHCFVLKEIGRSALSPRIQLLFSGDLTSCITVAYLTVRYS